MANKSSAVDSFCQVAIKMTNIILSELLNSLHLEDLGSTNSPSIFIDTPEYKILHLRLLKLEGNELVYDSLSFLITGHVIYRVTENQELIELKNQYEELHIRINNQLLLLTSILEEHSNAIERLEDRVFDRIRLRNTLSEIFEHKKNLMRLLRALDRMFVVLKQYMKSEVEELKLLDKEFSDLLEDTGVNQRLVSAQLGRLDDIYSYYTSIKNDNLNKNIYILSIISGIFLPLNLIVGFFGMNTSGLFLSEVSNGTQVVFYLIITIFAIAILGLPFLHLLDKFIVSKFFGRYKFYSRISKRLGHLNDDFNILDSK